MGEDLLITDSCDVFRLRFGTVWRRIIVVVLAIKIKASITGGNTMTTSVTSAKTIASYFISRSSELNESNDLTNLKLQKILFYAQAEHYSKHGLALFSEPIEAWDYGPVVSSVYHWLKGCGAYPITAFDVETDVSELDDAKELELSKIWELYSKYSAGFLVKKTHEDGSPWDQAFKQKKTIIGLEQLKQAKLANEWK